MPVRGVLLSDVYRLSRMWPIGVSICCKPPVLMVECLVISQSSMRKTCRFLTGFPCSKRGVASRPDRGVCPFGVCRPVQVWPRRMRIRCRPRVLRVGDLMILSVSGVPGHPPLGIGYSFVVRGVSLFGVYRPVQMWPRRVRIRCKSRVLRVGDLMIFSVSGISGRLPLGIGYGFVVLVGRRI